MERGKSSSGCSRENSPILIKLLKHSTHWHQERVGGSANPARFQAVQTSEGAGSRERVDTGLAGEAPRSPGLAGQALREPAAAIPTGSSAAFYPGDWPAAYA